MGKQLINVDFDGVLIPNYFEKKLVERLSGKSLDDKISCFRIDVFNWYIDMVNTSPLAPLNVPFLRFFEENSDKFRPDWGTTSSSRTNIVSFGETFPTVLDSSTDTKNFKAIYHGKNFLINNVKV